MFEYTDKNNKKYKFITNYKNNEKYRLSFNELTKKTFGFDCEQWYQDGYWLDNYIPYSLLDGDKIISNVSVSFMDYLVDGEKKHYIQLGTVMTDENYRGLGLSRVLIEMIIEEWKDRCDLFYLFANDRVLDFYPKFGFTVAEEYQFSKPVVYNSSDVTIRKLDMDNPLDKELLFRIVSKSIPNSKIAKLNFPSLVMFYTICFMKDNVYYFNDIDAIAIAEYEKDTLFVHDIFSTETISIEAIIDALLTVDTLNVVLDFVPKNTDSYNMKLLKEEDTTLMYKRVKSDIFRNGMFPVLSHT